MKTYLLVLPICLSLSLVGVLSDGFTTIINNNLVLDISDFELPWAEAVASCRSMNKTLLIVEDDEKDKVLVNLFIESNLSLPGNNSWISAYENREGSWEWESTGQPLFYQRWYIGQPDDLTSLNCAYQAVQGLLYWRDANCSAPMYFICQSHM